MVNPKKWKKIFNNRFFYLNESAYDQNKKVFGFSLKRNDQWKKHLSLWEVNLINYICGSRMKKLGYQNVNYNRRPLEIGLSIIKKDKLLKKIILYLKEKKLVLVLVT